MTKLLEQCCNCLIPLSALFFYSPFRIPHSVFRIPHSVFRIPHSSRLIIPRFPLSAFRFDTLFPVRLPSPAAPRLTSQILSPTSTGMRSCLVMFV